MKTPSQLLSDMQGTFLWGHRDCLSTIEHLAKEYLFEYEPIYTEWLEMTEPEAWKTALKRNGSFLATHRPLLLKAGLIEASVPVQPGDIVVADCTVTLPTKETWDGSNGRELLVFIDESFTYWYWGYTLSPVTLSAPPSTVFRFPALVK